MVVGLYNIGIQKKWMELIKILKHLFFFQIEKALFGLHSLYKIFQRMDNRLRTNSKPGNLGDKWVFVFNSPPPYILTFLQYGVATMLCKAEGSNCIVEM